MAAVIAPQAGKVAVDSAGRFFRGLLDAAGKPALTVSETRGKSKGAKKRVQWRFVGYDEERVGRRVVSRAITVPRWVAGLGGIFVAYYLIKTNPKANAAWNGGRASWATWWNAHKLAPWWSEFTPSNLETFVRDIGAAENPILWFATGGKV